MNMKTTKKRGLGRGLDSLLSSTPLSEVMKETTSNQNYRDLPVEMLQRGKYQPRRDIDPVALDDLASSIKSQGIIQPIVVRPVDDNKYEIIAGERRWRAAQLAGLSDVPVIIRDIPDEATVVISLIENIQREDLNSIEEAIALKRLLEEFTLTHQQVAESVGKSRSSVTNLLRLLELPETVRTMLEHGDLEMGHARTLLTLDIILQEQAARNIVAKGLSVRETESFVRKLQSPKSTSQPKSIDPDIANLQNKLSDKLAAKVSIQHSPKGSGKLIIHYHSLEALDGILEQFE